MVEWFFLEASYCNDRILKFSKVFAELEPYYLVVLKFCLVRYAIIFHAEAQKLSNYSRHVVVVNFLCGLCASLRALSET